MGLLKWSQTSQSGKWKTVKICESWKRSFWSVCHPFMASVQYGQIPTFNNRTLFWRVERLLICLRSLCESTLQNQAKMKVFKSFSSFLLQIIIVSVGEAKGSHLYLSQCQLLTHIISSYIKWPSWKSEVEKVIPAWQLEFLLESTKKPVHWHVHCLFIASQINSYTVFLSSNP